MHGIEDAGEVGGVEEAGRAATEINGVEMRGRCRAKARRYVKGNSRFLGRPRFCTRRSSRWELGRRIVDSLVMTAPESGIGKGEASGMVEAGAAVQGAPIADFALNGLGVGSIGCGRSDPGVKITVGALGLAEGHLDVDPDFHGCLVFDRNTAVIIATIAIQITILNLR